MALGDVLVRLRPMRRELELAASFEPPIRAEVFGIDRLETFARALAESDRVDPRLRGRPLLRRFYQNRKVLLQAQRRFAADARQGRALPPAAEWLLDNFYIIQDHLYQIEHDLSGGYYRELPKLAAGPQAGYPRVYGLALELLGHTDSRLDIEVITRFVQAYQAVAPLNSGELWAVAIMLRIGLIENLRRLIGQALVTHQRRQAAGLWAERVLRLANEAETGAAAAINELSQGMDGLDSAFVVDVLERLRDQSPALAPVVKWLEMWLTERGTNLDAITRAEHQARASNRLSVANVVTSLRTLAAIVWPDFFESTSLLERQLRLDPLGIYAGMDFETRDHYRHVVERLSRGSRLDETEVARRALAQARRYLVGHGGQAKPEGDLGALREGHVGFYLVDAGRRELERDLDYRPPLDEALRGAATRNSSLVYLGSIAVLTALFVWMALNYAAGSGLSALGLAGLALLSLLPASALAVNTVNYWATVVLPPASLPRLDYSSGVPAAFRTIVAVPALLSDLGGLQRLFDNLEIRYMANRDPHVHFALLCDFADAPNQHQPEDPALLEAAARWVAELNDRHGQAGSRPFYFFNRERIWNASEGVWMGWERKRGKLLEFNRLLRGAKNTHYNTCLGDLSVLSDVRFVINLDADTDLPINTARRLIAAMAHPLNRPRLDRHARLVVAGYGILQPRVAVNALAATRTRFARLFAGETGLDPYSAAVSTVYQDLFGRGNYIGKAIYDVDIALTVLDNRFPENLLLSHDLLEGSFARAGQVTEIQLLEDFPTGYDSFTQRQHRWTRGDWQITNWLLPSVPGPAGRRLPNPLPLIARWQIFDNLRLSLVPAATVALLAFSWTVLPGSALAWTAAALLPIYVNDVLSLILSSAIHPLGEPWLAYLRGVAHDAGASLARVLFDIACLPHAALVNLDAIGRVSVRRLFTHRGLLEWTSAAAAEVGQAKRISGFWARMWPAAALALGLLGLVALVDPARLPAALPLVALWVLAPFAAYWLSQPVTDREHRPLPAAAQAELRRTARRIWHFYEVFAGSGENWLPPDNYQLEPAVIVAHRTSPTNIGFLLLSALAAHDFGFLDGFSLVDRLERIFGTLERLQRVRGHLLNWYHTQSLQALGPEYISTVDSGNLAACLLVVKQACLQAGDWPLAPPVGLSSLQDPLSELIDAARRFPSQPAAAHSAAMNLAVAAEALARSLPAADGGQAGWSGLERVEREATALVQQAQALPGAAAAPVVGWAEALLGQARGWRQWAAQLMDAGGAGVPAGHSLAEAAEASSGSAAIAARDLSARAAALAARAEMLAAGMDFTFLFSEERGVFAIGYNLQAQALDNSFYDLLASEARLASLVAVARGQVPSRHWFRLGRPLTWAADSLAVLSWGGTMFEYLMPSLLARDYPQTLLAQTAQAVVRAQQQFGLARRVPWGVSESGFYAFDYQLNYQYQSFGVPELALRREQGENLVIAPYATFLALSVEPAAAWANLQRLARDGAAGQYGYYEALDYTPSRRPRGQSVAVVSSFMAHHQGMSLVALDNFLNGAPMLRRFHSRGLYRGRGAAAAGARAAPCARPRAAPGNRSRAAGRRRPGLDRAPQRVGALVLDSSHARAAYACPLQQLIRGHAHQRRRRLQPLQRPGPRAAPWQ